MTYNAEKKSYTIICWEKILTPEVWGKILTQTKSPIPRLISQMVYSLETDLTP